MSAEKVSGVLRTRIHGPSWWFLLAALGRLPRPTCRKDQRPGTPLQLVDAAVEEGQPGPDREVAHGAGDQDLHLPQRDRRPGRRCARPGPRARRRPRRSTSPVCTPARTWRPSWWTAPTQRARIGHGTRRTVEDSQRPVPGGVDDTTTLSGGELFRPAHCAPARVSPPGDIAEPFSAAPSTRRCRRTPLWRGSGPPVPVAGCPSRTPPLRPGPSPGRPSRGRGHHRATRGTAPRRSGSAKC